MFPLFKGAIGLLSHRDNRASRIASSFVVGERNNKTQTQRVHEHLCLSMDAASGADMPEAAVLECIVSSFDACPAVVHLI